MWRATIRQSGSKRAPLIIALVAFCLAVMAESSWCQESQYPNKSIRLVVAFAPGGIADTIARLVGQKLSDRFGHPMIVDNRGGAAGTVGAKFVAAAPPDGYTLLVHTAAIAVNAALARDTGIDAMAEFVPIALAASTPTILVVHASSPAKDLREFIQLAKGKRVNYASAGVGTTPHLTGDFLLRSLAGLDAQHVPFQGGAPAITAVLAQQIEMVSTSMPPAVPHIKQGKLKALVVTGPRRVSTLPDVPTVAELGFPEYEDLGWIAFFAPAKTSAAIAQKLNAEINEALRQSDVKERLIATGFEPNTTSPTEFAAYVAKEVDKWARVIKATGFKPQL